MNPIPKNIFLENDDRFHFHDPLNFSRKNSQTGIRSLAEVFFQGPQFVHRIGKMTNECYRYRSRCGRFHLRIKITVGRYFTFIVRKFIIIHQMPAQSIHLTIMNSLGKVFNSARKVPDFLIGYVHRRFYSKHIGSTERGENPYPMVVQQIR